MKQKSQRQGRVESKAVAACSPSKLSSYHQSPDHGDDDDDGGDGDDVDDHDDEMLQAEASRLRGEAAALQAALSNHRETCR